MNFYSGNQYAEITPVGDVEQYGKHILAREEVYNHIASIIETRLSKLNRLKCAISVRPFSNDDSDVQTAKLSTQIIKSAVRRKRSFRACSMKQAVGVK